MHGLVIMHLPTCFRLHDNIEPYLHLCAGMVLIVFFAQSRGLFLSCLQDETRSQQTASLNISSHQCV